MVNNISFNISIFRNVIPLQITFYFATRFYVCLGRTAAEEFDLLRPVDLMVIAPPAGLWFSKPLFFLSRVLILLELACVVLAYDGGVGLVTAVARSGSPGLRLLLGCVGRLSLWAAAGFNKALIDLDDVSVRFPLVDPEVSIFALLPDLL